MKAYVCNCKEHTVPGQNSKIMLEFDPRAEKAMVWNAEGQAENACRNFESANVEVDGKACSGFKVEGRAPKEFIVFCEYPGVP